MLYWHFRNLQCLLSALFRPRLESPTATLRKRFWANPFDTDWLNSIQAGRYFTYTDAGRWELAVRLGFLKAAFKNRWVIILGGQKIIYRRPVRLFRPFIFEMQIVGWDDKWLYVRQLFLQNDDTKAAVFTKVGLRGPKGLVDMREAFKILGYAETVPPPAWMDQVFSDDLKLFAQAQLSQN